MDVSGTGGGEIRLEVAGRVDPNPDAFRRDRAE
jgi:hypothetical protein